MACMSVLTRVCCPSITVVSYANTVHNDTHLQAQWAIVKILQGLKALRFKTYLCPLDFEGQDKKHFF